jgi:hypothetical protein
MSEQREALKYQTVKAAAAAAKVDGREGYRFDVNWGAAHGYMDGSEMREHKKAKGARAECESSLAHTY